MEDVPVDSLRHLPHSYLGSFLVRIPSLLLWLIIMLLFEFLRTQRHYPATQRLISSHCHMLLRARKCPASRCALYRHAPDLPYRYQVLLSVLGAAEAQLAAHWQRQPLL